MLAVDVAPKNNTHSIFSIGIVQKTILGFLLLTILLITVATLAWRMGDQLNTNYQTLSHRDLTNLEIGNYWIESFSEIAASITKYAANKDLDSIQKFTEEYQASVEHFQNDFALQQNLNLSNQEIQRHYVSTVERQSNLVINFAQTLIQAHEGYLNNQRQLGELQTQIAERSKVLEIVQSAEPNSSNNMILNLIGELQALSAAAVSSDNNEIRIQHRDKALEILTQIESLTANFPKLSRMPIQNFLILYKGQRGLFSVLEKRQQFAAQIDTTLANINHELEVGLITIKLLLSQVYKEVKLSTHAANDSFQSGLLWLAVCFAVALVCSILLTLTIPRSIKLPLQKILSLLEGLSKGNLRQKADYHAEDEFGELAESFDNTIEQLRKTVNNVADSAENISAATDENSSSVHELHNAMEEQSKDTTNVATAMTQMEQSFLEVARSAALASEQVGNAQNVANRGQHIIDENTEIVRQLSTKLNASSQRTSQVEEISNNIGSILDVIRGIAEQTNLLALNAAIEAARAGDQGRGFAVVADEVRTLAQKTGESTIEIGEMITQLQDAVSVAVTNMTECVTAMGSSQAKNEEVTATINEINAIVERVVDMASHIATATEQQQLTASEISRNITRISEHTENARVASQEISNTGDSLKALSTKQQGLVHQFSL